MLPLPDDLPFARFRKTPRELRAELARRGWRRVAGFQTRNPIHRAHEHLTKLALEVSDGIVIHPLVGETKTDDVPAAVRFAAYEALVANYYPAERTILAAFPAAMRYAGPREALFHALVRKNYGIDQLIIGRDHAGVGTFYPPLAAQEIFDRFPKLDLGLTPLKFEPTFYCRACDNLASARTCPHDRSKRVELSGTKVRETLASGGHLPEQFSRPEVAEILRAHYTRASGIAVSHATRAPASAPPAPPPPHGGFILWFTGLSGAGKSTLANAISSELRAERRLEILDGDEVRTHLSKGLGLLQGGPRHQHPPDRLRGPHARPARGRRDHGRDLAVRRDPRAGPRARRAAGREFVEVFARSTLAALVPRDVKGL